MRPPLNPADLILNTSPLPPIKTADELSGQAADLPPEIIHGMLHQGSKMIMGGASKGRKSWVLLDLAVCVSEGMEWWGFATTQTPTLYLNLEIQEPFAKKRLNWVKEVHHLDTLPNLKFWNLRGFSTGLEQLAPQISEELQHHNVGMLILDPLYKVLGQTEENANTEMAQLMNHLEALAVQHGCAVVFAHHFRKGGPSDSPSMDRMSGAGVLARDPDSIITMQDHEEEDCVVVEPTLRNFPPREPFGMRWKCPLFLPDPDLDTTKLRGKGGQPPKVGNKQVASLIPHKGGVTKKELVDKITAEHECSPPSAYRYIDKALKDGKIKHSPTGDLLVRP